MFKGKHQNNGAKDAKSPQLKCYSSILSHASMNAHIVLSHSPQIWTEWLETFHLPGRVSGTHNRLTYTQRSEVDNQHCHLKLVEHCFTLLVLYNNTMMLSVLYNNTMRLLW